MYELHLTLLSSIRELTAQGDKAPPPDLYFMYEFHFAPLGSRYSVSSLQGRWSPWLPALGLPQSLCLSRKKVAGGGVFLDAGALRLLALGFHGRCAPL